MIEWFLGRQRNYLYNKGVHVLNWCEKTWRFNVAVNGLKTSVLQLVGHSTVYVERYQSLFIFGGFTPMSIKLVNEPQLFSHHLTVLASTKTLLYT